MRFQRFDRVEVTWGDAHGGNGWRDWRQSGYHQPSLCKDIGYFLQANKKGVTLCRGYSPDDDSTVEGLNFIPKGCIVKIRRLR